MDIPGQLGPYRVLKRIGRGGMAEVLLATAFGASGFEKRVVLRTLLPELRGNAEFERMFLQEARLCALLSHRNLVQVHDLGVADGVYYARMDWVDGTDLARALSRTRPTVALALYIAAEVALALGHVHRACDEDGRPLGLVHRDVSPSNILLSKEGSVLLADFGIAKATMLRELTNAGVRKGKYGYMSPEQVDRRPLTAASDQFSLGVVLTEMIGGARPFDGDSPLETIERIRNPGPPGLPGVEDAVRDVIHRMLARDAVQRFPSMEEAYRALHAAQLRAGDVTPLDVAGWVRGD